jgi:hypothetical protein
MKHKKTQKMPIDMKVFVITLIISIVMMQVQRIRWIAYLNENGFLVKDIFVPANMWLPFHTTPTSIVVDSLCIVPFIILVIGVVSKLNNQKQKKAEPVN